MLTHVYLVRHAQPDTNNHDDLTRGLSPKGLSDRELVSQFLADKPISAIYSSPYLRALDTIVPFSEQSGLAIRTNSDFRERRISNRWIDNFEAFSKAQWSDFTYKLTDGESLQEVQERQIKSLGKLLKQHSGQSFVISSHGTALSTIVNYYQPQFAYEGFKTIQDLMPFLVVLTFHQDHCQNIRLYNLFEQGESHETLIL